MVDENVEGDNIWGQYINITVCPVCDKELTPHVIYFEIMTREIFSKKKLSMVLLEADYDLPEKEDRLRDQHGNIWKVHDLLEGKVILKSLKFRTSCHPVGDYLELLEK